MQVRMLDLPAQYAPIMDDIRAEIDKVLVSGQYINGPAVHDFECTLQGQCGGNAAVAVSSGTDALICALMACDIVQDDVVITTPYTFIATAEAIARVGAYPAFVDIDPQTFNIDAAKIEKAIEDKWGAAVLPVHLFGQMADMETICDIAKKHDLKVISDAAQAYGAQHWAARGPGDFGDAACFSFFPSKNLGGFGDGGAVVTKDFDLAERIRRIRNHGSADKATFDEIGGNFRMDTIQAAILQKLSLYVSGWNKDRFWNVDKYWGLLNDCTDITCPNAFRASGRTFNQFVARVPADKRDDLRKHLKDAGVDTAVYYAKPLHLQPCFAYLGYEEGDFPEAERAAKETLALPVHPMLTPEQIEYVADKIKEFFAR